ncbi:polysaccharide deacetylase [Clostridium sp. MCC353]|uniref:polysaccharide deacetylase family protein n=1 Tax=Clostridium sp. MCC353 TaxID=2592646 RepID=UPI001C02FF27|nr:polysaccharide deacetylase family protein [Clostridium sp. MCC353]MBT9775640.1 polysaccharide deacetylase [Clostridium sp. MCC353]
MGKMDYRRRRLRRGRRKFINYMPIILTVMALLVVLVTGGLMIKKQFFGSSKTKTASEPAVPVQTSDQVPASSEEPIDIGNSELELLIEQADLLAMGYDYDGAVSLLQDSAFALDPQAAEAISRYEEAKKTLVKVDNSKITHIFFHTLIMDTSKAFDGDSMEKGYNQMMTTKDEFLKIIQSMYDRGFVLVRIHDIAEEVIGEDGVPRFVKKDILLPEGKQPFVMSQDDVCYYEYMEGDGFASRMVIGEDGKPACEMKMADGTVSTGSYDLVPLLEDFIQEHPDFSYKGARAIIAFTGYNGILGYRTAASYSENPTYEQDREEAAKVAQCLRDNGWELASHSWGHRNMGAISYEDFKKDTDKWKAEVESLIGPTDIILFPFGSDIGDWHPYTNDNSRFEYLKSAGFRYFCNVDSHQYWIQFGEDHLRQGRRNVDGYRMYYDLPETNPSNPKLSDLIDVEKVFDPARPKPVAPMGK